MKITLKDGSVKEYAESKSVYDIALDLSEGLARAACCGKVDGEVVDLRTVLDKDCELQICTAADAEGLATIRHTASHVLAEAVKTLFPDAKLTIGPSIDTGFYYDFDHVSFSREDLDKLEAEMKKIIKKGEKLEKFTLPREEAIQLMKEKDEPYKVELIEALPEGEEISFYRQGEFVDLCAGPHLMSTKGIKAFKLTSSSMAYWHGDSSKAQLQRIYGTAFNKKEELEEKAKQEAKINKENEVVAKAVENATVDIPEVMIERQMDRMLNDIRYRLSMQGISLEDYCKFTGTTMDAMKAEMKGDAERRVKTQLVLDAIVKAEDIKADPEAVEKKLDEYCAQFGDRAAEFKEKLSEDDKAYFEDQAVLDKTLEMLCDSAVEK